MTDSRLHPATTRGRSSPPPRENVLRLGGALFADQTTNPRLCVDLLFPSRAKGSLHRVQRDKARSSIIHALNVFVVEQVVSQRAGLKLCPNQNTDPKQGPVAYLRGGSHHGLMESSGKLQRKEISPPLIIECTDLLGKAGRGLSRCNRQSRRSGFTRLCKACRCQGFGQRSTAWCRQVRASIVQN